VLDHYDKILGYGESWEAQERARVADEEQYRWMKSQQRVMNTDLDSTLNTRHETYGKFEVNATIAQGFKRFARATNNWDKLSGDQKEALDQMFSKIGRLLTGDPNHYDTWHDLAGYATLVADKLQGNAR
jgi:hypothetical protein